MKRWQMLASAMILGCAAMSGGPGPSGAQTKPEGEIRFAVYVTIAPAWLDPGETSPGNLTPFWMQYALHDALVKPMPGNGMAPSLAESWTESPDKLSYEFKLRQGVKFHNGDPFTADDVKFSFERAKGAQLKQKVKEVVVVDPHTVRFVLNEVWPDFMTAYGTLWSAAGWITPKNYFEKVGADEFKKHPIGLGPYKFVSMKPGIELVLEANEEYWRKMPSVKRLVYLSVPESTTRLAMLKRGEADIAYLLEGQLAESIKDDPQLKVAFSGGIGTHHLDFFDMWDPKSPWHDPRVRKAASLAIDRKGLSEAETLGASKPTGNIVLKSMQYALPIEPDPYDPQQAKKLLAEAGYPNGFDGGDLTPIPPYNAVGEAAVNYLGAVGIRMNSGRWSGPHSSRRSRGRNSGGCAFARSRFTATPRRGWRKTSQAAAPMPMAAGPMSMSCTRSSLPKPIPRSASKCCTRYKRFCTSACVSRRFTIISGRAASDRASRIRR